MWEYNTDYGDDHDESPAPLYSGFLPVGQTSVSMEYGRFNEQTAKIMGQELKLPKKYVSFSFYVRDADKTREALLDKGEGCKAFCEADRK